MTASEVAIKLIKGFEGFRAKAYWDNNGWAVGYGSHLGVKEGMVVTEPEADQMLRIMVSRIDETLAEQHEPSVSVTQNQYDALISFAYNVGTAALLSSTLLHKLNQGNIRGAADEFLRWDHNKGKVDVDLEHRRAAERLVFLGV